MTAMKMFSTLSRLDEFFMDLRILFLKGGGGLDVQNIQLLF